ncbi:MAG: PilW family protein [Negativicutes bacterium]
MKILDNRGFSLVELLIGVTMFVILLAGVSGMLTSGIKSSQYDLSVGHILAPGRNAVNIISDRLRYDAVNITSPVISGSGAQINFSDGTNTYVIYRNSTARSIVITKNGAADPANPTLAAGMVETLTFTRGSDARDITITVLFNDKAYTGSPDRTISVSVVALNAK